MSEQQRDDEGKFGEKVTNQDVLKAFDAADAPVMTANELAGKLSVSRSTMNRRLDIMRDADLVDRKETGARAVAWWATVAPRLSPEARRRADAADPDAAVSLDELEAEFASDA
jgi:DNA-binding transcriptional regulator YhcF (GntR family)